MRKIICNILMVMLLTCVLTSCTSFGNNASGNEWISEPYLDEFGEEIGKDFLTTKHIFEGTFTDMAYKDARLGVRIMVDSENVSFILYENVLYGKPENEKKPVVNEYYSITMRAEDKTDYEFLAAQAAGNIHIYIHPDSKEDFCNALCNNSKLKFRLQGQFSEYSFEVDSLNFAEEYQKFMK